MKTVILRAPETDRKKVDIPTLLTDLTDYGKVNPAYGTATRSTLLTVEAATTKVVPLTAYPVAVGITPGSGNIAVDRAGWYLMVATIEWNVGPDAVFHRGIHIYKNGTSLYNVKLCSWIGLGHFDQLSYMAYLAAGDVVQPGVQNYDGVAIEANTTLFQIGRFAS